MSKTNSLDRILRNTLRARCLVVTPSVLLPNSTTIKVRVSIRNLESGLSHLRTSSGRTRLT